MPECTIFFHKNNFEYLCNDPCYDDNDINCVNDDIYANEEEMWRYAVPECTEFNYTPQNIMYKNKNKNTYPGYQCSFIHPHNFDINECEQNNNSINQNRGKGINYQQMNKCPNMYNKYNTNYINKNKKHV